MATIIQTIERVTPAIAKRYLDSSIGNRPLSAATIKNYANTMKNGGWKLNGVPIVFDESGHLLDGHHRLYAIINADCSVEMSVTRGVATDTFTTFDCGRHRNLGQLLAINDVPNYNDTAAVVSANVSLEVSGQLGNSNSAKRYNLTNDVYYLKYKNDPEDYDECTAFAKKCYKQAKILKISWIGGATYYLSHTGGYDIDYVKKFFKAVCSLENSDITPAVQLRNFILRNERNNKTHRVTNEYIFAILVKAWNAYVRNKAIGRLVYMPSQEECPKFKLNKGQNII